jgi:hypothetical protein
MGCSIRLGVEAAPSMMPVTRRLRPLIYAAEKLIQRARYISVPEPAGGWPILLGVSFPKSGTHLLDQILLGFSRVAPFARRLRSFYAEYDGASGDKRGDRAAETWVDSLRPRDVASAHLFARPGIVERVDTGRFVPHFIYRDPRDVVVSHVFYVTDMEPKHVHHAYYRSLPDFNARLEVSIRGRPEAHVEFPGIAERFEPYLGWLDRPGVLTIRFEDLIHDRLGTLRRIAVNFLERVAAGLDVEQVIRALGSSIDPRRSPTFRTGTTGEWQTRFTPRHRALFKEVAGDLLTRLGYEVNGSW